MNFTDGFRKCFYCSPIFVTTHSCVIVYWQVPVPLGAQGSGYRGQATSAATGS